jgi:hypothetical protein
MKRTVPESFHKFRSPAQADLTASYAAERRMQMLNQESEFRSAKSFTEENEGNKA